MPTKRCLRDLDHEAQVCRVLSGLNHIPTDWRQTRSSRQRTPSRTLLESAYDDVDNIITRTLPAMYVYGIQNHTPSNCNASMRFRIIVYMHVTMASRSIEYYTIANVHTHTHTCLLEAPPTVHVHPTDQILLRMKKSWMKTQPNGRMPPIITDARGLFMQVWPGISRGI